MLPPNPKNTTEASLVKVLIFFSCTVNRVRFAAVQQSTATTGKINNRLCEVTPNCCRQSGKSAGRFTNETTNFSVQWCVWRNTWANVYKVINILDVLLIKLDCWWNIFPWLRTLVFLRLIVRPKYEHTDENWLNSVCRSWAEWATSAASSSNHLLRWSVLLLIFKFTLLHFIITILPLTS